MHLNTWVNWSDIMFVGQQTEIHSSTMGYFGSRDLREVLIQPLFLQRRKFQLKEKEMIFPKESGTCSVD